MKSYTDVSISQECRDGEPAAVSVVGLPVKDLRPVIGRDQDGRPMPGFCVDRHLTEDEILTVEAYISHWYRTLGWLR